MSSTGKMLNLPANDSPEMSSVIVVYPRRNYFRLWLVVAALAGAASACGGGSGSPTGTSHNCTLSPLSSADGTGAAATPGTQVCAPPGFGMLQECNLLPGSAGDGTETQNWMGCLYPPGSPEAASTLISELVIPGSHDAGTYDLDRERWGETQGSLCTNWSPAFHFDTDGAYGFAIAQDISIADQLNAGSRFLDMRIAWTGTAEGISPAEWRVIHTFWGKKNLMDTLGEIVDWAESHPDEILIVDFQHFCNDNRPSIEEKRIFVDSLTKTRSRSGKSMCDLAVSLPKAKPDVTVGTLTIADARESGGNIIVIFPHSELESDQITTLEGACNKDVNTGAARNYRIFWSVEGDSCPSSFAGHPASTADTAIRYCLPLVHAWPANVNPECDSTITNPDFGAANRALLNFPLSDGRFGKMVGKGLYQAQLIYSLSGKNLPGACTVLAYRELLVWEENLAAPTKGEYLTRTDIVNTWGKKAGIVYTDKVQGYGSHDPVVKTVIAQNAPGYVPLPGGSWINSCDTVSWDSETFCANCSDGSTRRPYACVTAPHDAMGIKSCWNKDGNLQCEFEYNH